MDPLMFEDRAARDAYRRGVHDALESGIIHQSGARMRALQQWVIDLEAWSGGEPPDAPHLWPVAQKGD